MYGDEMNPNEIRHGFLYAVASHDDSLDSLEPYLAIATDDGFRFVHAGSLSIEIDKDGPHAVSSQVLAYASSSGWHLDVDAIWSLWSERKSIEELIGLTEDVQSNVTIYSVADEAERILRENNTPDGKVSTWIRHSRDWPGSSMTASFNEEGELIEARVVISIRNPYALRSLLRWLRVPHDLVEGVTLIDRLGRKIRGHKRGTQGD